MSITAIICEFNPFHFGHKYIIDEAKSILPQNDVICLMSGNMVQRGELSLWDKKERAKAAILNGASAVFELPSVFALAPAKEFATGAIRILSQIDNITDIVFGSQCGNIELLKNYADITSNENEIMKFTISEELKKGINYPSAYSNALNKIFKNNDSNILSSPNDVLGIEYIKAISKLNSKIKSHTIIRTKNSESASKIRDIALSKNNWNKLVPNYEVYSKINFYSEILFPILKYKISNSTEDEISKIYEVNEGLQHRILKVIETSNSFEEYLQNIKSKRYTMAKIKRIMLSILIGKTKEIVKQADQIDYVKLIAIDKNKRKLLSQKSSIKIITKSNELQNVCSKNLLKIDKAADDLFNICNNNSISTVYTNKIQLI